MGVRRDTYLKKAQNEQIGRDKTGSYRLTDNGGVNGFEGLQAVIESENLGRADKREVPTRTISFIPCLTKFSTYKG